MQGNYILDILGKILLLQKQEFDEDIVGCDKPFLGPSTCPIAYNTRPIQLYNSYTALPWAFSYSIDGASGESSILRVEALDQSTVTVRVLIYDATNDSYTNTNQFVTINTSTIGAIRCLADTYITL